MRASATARNRRHTCSPLVPLPNVSASHSRLYFLDGDATLKYLKPTGESGTVRDLNVGPNQEAVFAASPDDSRLAVVVLDHLQYPVTTRLYVEDLASGTNHLELFSGTVLEWPVAWYRGNLLMAVGINAPPQNCIDSFSYASLGYHVADPNTGNRIRSVCDGWTSYSPPVPAGTLCINGAVPLGQAPSKVESWDGATRILRNVGGCPQNGVLSPDGTWIASNEVSAAQNGCTGQASIYLLATDGRIVQTPAVGSAEGWIDSDHLVVGGEGESAPASVFDVSAKTTKHVGVLGFFAGTLPNDFSSTY